MKTIIRMFRVLLATMALVGAGDALAITCAEDGGGAQCTQPIYATPWQFGACNEGGDYLRLSYGWCIARGGTWVPDVLTSSCVGSLTEITEGSFMGLAMQAETIYRSPCGGINGTMSMTGATSTMCGNWPAVAQQNGMTVGRYGTATFHYHNWIDNQTCDSAEQTFRYIVGSATSLKCPMGYRTSILGNGDLMCYIPPPCKTCKGNPTDVGNGAKRQQETDYASTAPGGISFVRSYYSAGFFAQAPRDPVSTDYWRHNYSSRLVPYTSNAYLMAAIQRPDGTISYFKTNGKELNNVDGAAATLVAVAGPGAAAWKHTTADFDVEFFDSAGRLLSVTQRAGFVHTLAYDGSGRLSTVTDSFGRSITLTYDASSRLATMTDPSSRAYTYGYDTTGRLTSVTYPGPRTRSYVYESSEHPWGLTGIIDERGARLSTYAYDAIGMVASSERAGQENKYTFTYSANQTATTTYIMNAFGYAEEYEFIYVNDVPKLKRESLSGSGSEHKTFDANGNVATKMDRQGNTTTYVYDLTRNLETSRTEGSGSAVARTITTTWHATYRLPATITEPSGVAGVNLVTEFTYDTAGNLTKKKLTAGALTREWNYTYNAFGQVLTIDGPRTDVTDVTTLTYYADNDPCVGCRGQVVTVANALGHVTTYNAYNGDGRATQITDPNGLVTTLAYNARGWLESRTVGGDVTQYLYDGTGNLIRTTMPDGSWISYAYDDANGLVEIADRLGNIISYELDVYGNRVEERAYDPQGVLRKNLFRLYDSANRLHKEVGAEGQTTEYIYTGGYNLFTKTDPNFNSTYHYYDGLGRLFRILDAAQNYTNFTYDAKDHLKTVQDPRGLTTTYTYSGLGDLTQLASPDTGTTSYTPDSAGNVATQTDARSVTTTYTYDTLNRVTAATVTDGTVTYEYDNLTTGGPYAKGRLTQITDPSGNTTWSYDVQGRVTGKTQTVTATPTSKIFAVGYAYSDGHAASATYPSGRVVTYGYDLQGRPTSLTVDGVSILSNAGYAPFGAVAKWAWGNGEIYERTIDLNARITGVTLGPSTGTYSDLNQGFGYDLMNRLNWAALAAGQTQSFTYDANSNRTNATINAASTTYTYPGSNHKLSSLSGATTRSFTYDNAGNLTSSAGVTYVYDGRGRMKSAGATTYLVNGLGQRVKKAAGTDRFFVYDQAGRLIGEYDATGAPIQEVVWFADQPVAVIKPNGGTFDVFYVWADHLGSPRVISDTSNGIRWEWAHSDPFGNNAANENPSGLGAFNFNLRFPGQYFDAEAGNHYNYFRNYDPRIGRYSESDPLGLGGGLNSYGYVRGNPLRLVDVHGLLSAADGELGLHFYRGNGRYKDISSYCSSYMEDPGISMLRQSLRLKADGAARGAAGRLAPGETDYYYFEQQSHIYIAPGGIYSFGDGVFHFQNLSCKLTGLDCNCARADCAFNFSAVDEFKDPIDLCQKAGICGKAKNLGGTPFWFGLSCDDSYSVTACKK